MCLGGEWFAAVDARNRQRDLEGVLPDAAEEALYCYHSTVRPIATEMAEWLYRNWTLQDLLRLSKPTRDLLLHIIEAEGISRP